MTKNWQDATFRFCITGSYGYDFSNYLEGQQSPFTFIDIGANQGLYSLLAAKNPNCIKVYSFEPVRETFRYLTQNVTINSGSDKVLLFNKGISDVPGMYDIQIPRNHSGAAAVFRQVENRRRKHRTETVEFVSTESLNTQLLDAVVHPVIVKIDVEGHELEVLTALSRTVIASNFAAVYYEVDERWVEPVKIEAILRGLGLTKFRKFGSGIHYDILASQ